MAMPISGHLVFNGLSCISVLLLGHPLLAAVAFIVSSAVDALFQQQVKRWRSCQVPEDPSGYFTLLAAACSGRAAVLLLVPTMMACQGSTAGLIYFGVVCATITALSPSNGSLSGKVFLAYAAPPLTAAIIVILARMSGLPALGAVLSVATLGLILTLICIGTRKAIGGWQTAYAASQDHATDLEAAHRIAITEKTAAEEAREEARRANNAKSNFLATMSHEIRTPMNGVLGMARLLRRDEKNPRQRERIDTLLSSGEYLLAILNDILDASKIDAGKLELALEAESLHSVLRDIVAFWGPRADEKNLQLTLSLDDNAPDVVWIDALRLRQILFNLLGNALKFTEQGHVACRVQARPLSETTALVHFAICDTGPGIRVEDAAVLFERFSQADDAATRKFGGTGLGLTIARQLVELMGGRIWAESVFGEGAEFHIELALDLAPAISRHSEVAPPKRVPQPADLNVLIVDDNAVNLLVLNQILTAFGHRVTQAADGPEALARLDVQRFDVVVMDIQMPGMTGVEALHRLQAGSGPNKLTPVIALTADVTSGGREMYLAQGFSEHRTKPIEIEPLMDAITAATAKPARALHDPIQGSTAKSN